MRLTPYRANFAVASAFPAFLLRLLKIGENLGRKHFVAQRVEVRVTAQIEFGTRIGPALQGRVGVDDLDAIRTGKRLEIPVRFFQIKVEGFEHRVRNSMLECEGLDRLESWNQNDDEPNSALGQPVAHL